MILLALLAQAAFPCPAPAFHDGDNISCARGVQMRLAGIDAPELPGSPRCGKGCDGRRGIAARDHLRRLAGSRPVRCRLVDATPRVPGFQAADRYGRPVVRCAAAGVGDLGEAMVRDGHARRWR